MNFNYVITVRPGENGEATIDSYGNNHIPEHAESDFEKLFQFIPDILRLAGGVMFTYKIEIIWENLVYTLESCKVFVDKFVVDPQTGDVSKYRVNQTEKYMLDEQGTFIGFDPDFEQFETYLKSLAV